NQRILDYDILANQEPWRNPFDKLTTHHPIKDHFHLIFPKDNMARVCFFVNKQLDTTSWTASHTSSDACTITLRLKAADPQDNSEPAELIPPPKLIHIHNIYNPSPTSENPLGT